MRGSPASKIALAVVVPFLTLLLTVLISSSRIAVVNRSLADLRAQMNARFDAQDRSLAEKLQRFAERIDARPRPHSTSAKRVSDAEHYVAKWDSGEL
jgi:hypothetical protein